MKSAHSVARAEVSMAAPVPRVPGSSAALRVLVVDDNVDGVEALCALLSSLGCVTAAAYDGASGLATAAVFGPHLALIDLEMPGLCGCDVARHLRAGPVPNPARLICLTGRGQPEDRRLCMEAGFDDFFLKPMPPKRLVDVVAAANAELCRRPSEHEVLSAGGRAPQIQSLRSGAGPSSRTR